MVSHVNLALPTLTLLCATVGDLNPVKMDCSNTSVEKYLKAGPAFSAVNLVMLSHDCSLLFFVGKLDESIAAVSVLALLHLDHGQVALVTEVLPDLLLSGRRLHPQQDHVPTVGIILVCNTLCLDNKLNQCDQNPTDCITATPV